MSNDPHHWMHFYQRPSPAESTLPQSASLSASLSSSPPPTHANPTATGSGGGSTSLNPEGGVTKPARRRTRASRRTPTTVMNTDTTNFRAMVQQFTGASPSTTLGSGSGPNMLSFGFGQEQAPASGLGHVQYPHQQFNNMLSLNTNNNNTYYYSNQGGEGFGSGPSGYHQGVPRRSSSSDDNRGNNNSDYMF